MNAPSERPPTDHTPPLRPQTSGEAASQASAPGHSTRDSWLGFIHWFQANSFAPRWLPTWARHSLLGYLGAALIELAAAGVMLAFVHLFPDFAFLGALAFLGVVGMALGWGAGPSLCATLVGAFLIYYVLLPPSFSWRPSEPADVLGLAVYLVVGFSIGLLASRSERARRHAEEMNQLLAQAEARSTSDYQRLRTVLDVLPSAVAIANADGQILEVNQATTTLWGEEVPLAAEIAQYHLYRGRWARTGQPLAPEDWTLVRALTRGEAVQNDEIELETPDGQCKVILVSAAPMRDEAGAITGAVASTQDITEVRRLEREVADHAAALETIFETMTDGIALVDTQGMLVQTNQAFRTLIGVDQHPAYATLPPLERLAVLDVHNEHGQYLPVDAWPPLRLLRGETLRAVDLQVKNLEGREVAVNVSGAPLRDATGHITGGVQVFRDLTERRHLERRTREALNALLAMAEVLVQVHPQAVPLERAGDTLPPLAAPTLPLVARRLADLTRRVLACRRVSMVAVEATTRLLHPITVVGLPPEQEQAWWDSWSPPRRMEERFDARIAAAVDAGEPVRLDRAHLPEHAWSNLYEAKSGLLVPMRMGEELVGLLLVDYGEEDQNPSSQEELALLMAISRLGALVLDRDRLLRQWAEARANELALRAIKERMDTFLGIVSHELGTPLTAIKLRLQLTQRRLQSVARSQAEAEEGAARAEAFFLEQLTLTLEQVERLERLVSDLVDVSRIQADQLEIRPEWTDLAAIVRTAVAAQRQAAPTRTISLHLPGEQPLFIYADPMRLEQVVTNYLTNALKYSPEDRPIVVGLVVEGQHGRVWVRDEGPGLPVEEQERVWERFHRVKGMVVQSGSGAGLGLGLHICRMILEQHGGQVGVESTPGQGSTFWFTLPIGHPAEVGQRAE